MFNLFNSLFVLCCFVCSSSFSVSAFGVERIFAAGLFVSFYQSNEAFVRTNSNRQQQKREEDNNNDKKERERKQKKKRTWLEFVFITFTVLYMAINQYVQCKSDRMASKKRTHEKIGIICVFGFGVSVSQFLCICTHGLNFPAGNKIDDWCLCRIQLIIGFFFLFFFFACVCTFYCLWFIGVWTVPRSFLVNVPN